MKLEAKRRKVNDSHISSTRSSVDDAQSVIGSHPKVTAHKLRLGREAAVRNSSRARALPTTKKKSQSLDGAQTSILHNHSFLYSVDYITPASTVKLLKMAAEPPATKKCMGGDCDNDAGSLQCPTCLKLGMKESFFCSQDCFKRNWVCSVQSV
jgi:hypothetical protein